MARAPKIPKPKPLFSRPEVIGLCKRFLKPDEFAVKYYDPVKSVMAMYKLVRQFPNREFWMAYQLGFQLRSIYWLLGADGQDRLKRDWSVFTLDLGPQETHTVGTEKVGVDIKIEKPKTSVADFLS